MRPACSQQESTPSCRPNLHAGHEAAQSGGCAGKVRRGQAAAGAALFLAAFLYAFWRVGKVWPGVPLPTDGVFTLKQARPLVQDLALPGCNPSGVLPRPAHEPYRRPACKTAAFVGLAAPLAVIRGGQ